MKILVRLIGFFLSILNRIWTYYNAIKVSKRLGGGKRIIQYPFQISGIENIHMGESVNIGKGSTLMCTRANIVFKGHFISGPKLTIITGDHMSIVGKFIDEVKDEDKDILDINRDYDKEVIIEEDVWCGANVTIMKGVTIGRGCIIASGAIVTKNIPPYTIAGGIPAKAIKERFNLCQAMEHEKQLYSENIRKTAVELQHLSK